MQPLLEKYSFVFRNSDNLTSEEKEDLYQLCIKLFPAFAKYYEKNRFYSSVKPQMCLSAFDNKRVIADCKFLWRDIQLISNQVIKLFVFGYIVDTAYQGQGIASHFTDLCIEKTKELGGDLLYCTTSNPITVKILEKRGFKQITTKLVYTDALTDQDVVIDKHKHHSYGLDFESGLIEKINSFPQLHLGIGPL